tara:strand:+ start:2181 stop:2423 length:243 start_codon:yes stop_codon:yes gene_type:complete
MKQDLKIGDIVVDQVTNEVGLLVDRYILTNKGCEDPLALWAWDIYWIGKNIDEEKRLVTWTEFGLTNIIKAGTFVHYKDI